MSAPSERLRAHGVIFADQVRKGDVVFASYHRRKSTPPDPTETPRGSTGRDELVCAWVEVYEIKHHTDTTVTLLSRVLDDPDACRWVEYPRDAPLVLGLPGASR